MAVSQASNPQDRNYLVTTGIFLKLTTSFPVICPKSNFQASFHRGWDLQRERRGICGWFLSFTLKTQFLAMEVLATMQDSAVTRNRHSRLWQHESFLTLDNIGSSIQFLNIRCLFSLSNTPLILLEELPSSRNRDPSPTQTQGTGQIGEEVNPFPLPVIGSRIEKWPRISLSDKLCLSEKCAGSRGEAGLLEKVTYSKEKAAERHWCFLFLWTLLCLDNPARALLLPEDGNNRKMAEQRVGKDRCPEGITEPLNQPLPWSLP